MARRNDPTVTAGRTPAARAAAGGLALAWLLLGAGCDAGPAAGPVVTVASEREANEILVVLAGADLPATKKDASTRRDTRWEIRLKDASRSIDAMRVLVELDLPRERPPGLQTIVDSTGIIPTKTDERARLMLAMAGELEQTFETFDGVVDARVHVVIPERSLTSDDSARASASVVIKHTGEESPLTKDEVIGIVTNAVEGIEPAAPDPAETNPAPPTPVQNDADAPDQGQSGPATNPARTPTVTVVMKPAKAGAGVADGGGDDDAMADDASGSNDVGSVAARERKGLRGLLQDKATRALLIAVGALVILALVLAAALVQAKRPK